MARGDVGAPLPLTGRYAVQGAQVRAELELWARHTGARLVFRWRRNDRQLEATRSGAGGTPALDDCSDPREAARLHEDLVAGGCRFVLGPYGSDSTRAVARARAGRVVWNHGAAADDVQRLPGVVSVPSPASRYLVALGRAVARLSPVQPETPRRGGLAVHCWTAADGDPLEALALAIDRREKRPPGGAGPETGPAG